MFHAIESDKGPCPAEPSLAMNGYRTLFLLGSLQELVDYVIGRCRSIQEIEIDVLDTGLSELLLLILRLVKSDDHCDPKFLEDRDIVIRGKGAVLISCIERPREGDELPRDDPVEIAILDLLKVLIFLHIECRVRVPAQAHSELEASETVMD